MEDMKRVKISGKAIPVRGNDIDTDRIIPARYLKCVVFDGLGEHAFEDDRQQLKEAGKQHPLDNPVFAQAEIMLVNKNFGCGSSREHAPQSIRRWNKGIKALVGESFAEIFFGNCIALGIPCVTVDEGTIAKLQESAEKNPDEQFTLDLEKMIVSDGTAEYKVTLAEGPRQQFIEGKWDSTAELMAGREAVAAVAARLPYVNDWK